MMHELHLGGHIYQQLLKERIQVWLEYLKVGIVKRIEDETTELTSSLMMQALKQSGNVNRVIENFLATGNINSRSGLGLMQNSGLVILAENINRMRYMSHFKSVHRGSFFVEMRTTEARQLLPEAWGFICPVHTPDGTPCGLLNHLTVNCVVSTSPNKKLVENIPTVLTELGMIPNNSTILSENIHEYYVVVLEGRIIGYIRHSESSEIIGKLRLLKIAGKRVPKMMEIGLVPIKKVCVHANSIKLQF